MSRIKLQFPEKIAFETCLSVRISDINYGNHLGHDSLISLAHEARIRFLRSFNYIETDIEGVGFVVSDLAVQYKNEAFYGDRICIQIAIEKRNKRSCTLYYHLKNEDKTIAIMQTGITFYNFSERVSVSIPKAFIERVLS